MSIKVPKEVAKEIQKTACPIKKKQYIMNMRE